MRRYGVLGVTALLAALTVGVAGGRVEPTAAQSQTPAMASAAQSQNPFTSPAGQLRMKLHQDLSEHTALAAVVTQKAATGAPDFEAARAAIDQNSQSIASQIGTLYGQDAANQFLPMWRAHIQGYLDYTLAGDAARKDAVRQALQQWVGDQTNMFVTLNPMLPRDVVESDLNMHVMGTLQAIDAFAAQDFPRHYQLAHDGFVHSFMMGDHLAAGIIQQFPDRFPQ
jgi:hypothetical protein